MAGEAEGAEGTEVEFEEVVQDPTEDNLEASEEETTPEGESESETTETDEVEGEEEEVFVVRIDGEEVEVTLDELLNGYSRQADYTRKTQELAATRQRFEAFERLEQALQENPAAVLESLARAYEVNLAAAGDESTQEELDPVERELAEVRARLERQDAEAARRAAREAVEAEMAEVSKAKNIAPDFDWDPVFRLAVERGIQNLEDAYDLWSARTKPAPKRTEVVERKRRMPKVAGGTRRASGSTVTASKTRPTIEEAFAEAFAEHTS